MTGRNSRGWLTIEQLRSGIPEQAAKLGADGVTSAVVLTHQDDVLGGGFYVTFTRRRGHAVLERHEWSYARVDEARTRFTHTQRRFDYIT